MAQDANKILGDILGVVTQINRKLDGSRPGTESTGESTGKADEGTGGTSGRFSKMKDKFKELKAGNDIMKGIFSSITNFSKVKINPKNIDRTAIAIDKLFNVIIKIGKSSKTVINAMRMFDALTEALKQMTPFVKALSGLLMSIGISILLIAGAIVLAGKMLGVKAVWAIPAIITSIAVLVGGLVLLGKAEKWVTPGAETAEGMGNAFKSLSIGMLAFVLSWKLIALVLGAGEGLKGMGMAALFIVGTIVAMAGLFWLLGKGGKALAEGVAVSTMMGVGIAALGLGVLVFALVAKALTSMGVDKEGNKKNDKKTKFGAMMSEVGPGLGVMGIVLVSMALLFAGMGVLAIAIIPGVVAGLFMAGGMIALALATRKVMKVGAELEGKDVAKTVSGMVSGLIKGLVQGLSAGLMGKEVDSANKLEFKGFLKLNRGLRMLRRMSRTVSLFAKALTAFAEVDNMRVITGYDDEGEPQFGPTINIRKVGRKITDTLTTFLIGDGSGEPKTGGLLGATDGLTRKHSAAIGRMARALTGRRGMLTAIIQFADVLKTFAQFGPKGEIGYVEMVPDGVDDDGKAKFKQEPRSVKITKVTESIVNSISLFSKGIASKVEGISNRDKRQILNMSKALIGKQFGEKSRRADKPGLLEPINAFSETLMIYAKFGKKGDVPVLDDEGKPTGKSVSIKKIVANIVTAISTFSKELSGQLSEPGETVKQAQKKMEGYMGMLEQLGILSVASEGLDKTAVSLMSMATSMKALSESINSFEIDKLEAIGEITKDNNSFGSFISKSQEAGSERREDRQENRVDRREDRQERRSDKTTDNVDSVSDAATSTNKTTDKVASSAATSITPAQQAINTEELANAVGASVAAAFRQGHFQFEFATDKSGVLSFSQ